MKLKKLSGAVGAACLAMTATSAFALPASSWTTSNTANFYISGASAQDNGILTFALQECLSGSLHRYAIANNFVYFCTPGATLTVGSSQVAIYKYSVGGSGSGVGFVRDSTPLPFLNLAAIAASCAALPSNITTAATFGTLTQPYVNTVCGASSTILATNSQIPRLGLSDMEPEFFVGSKGALLDEAVATLIFGVPVSRNVYQALQAQQGITTANPLCANTASSTSSWEYSNDCMPSLSREQIVSAYTQVGQTWAGIGVNFAGPVYVARRVDSSGTQKTFEALVARTPNGGSGLKSCVSGTDVFVPPDSGNVTTGDAFATACGTAPATVFAGSGGGDVRSCLITHHAAGRGAIGILTAEDIASATTNWRFVKVNGGTATNRGYGPTHADVAAGRYQFWTVPTLNYLPTVPGGLIPPYSTAGVNVYQRLKFQLADPVGLSIQQPFGASGLMANWDLQGNPALPLDFTGASAVNPWGRLVGGTTLDNCQMGKAANF